MTVSEFVSKDTALLNLFAEGTIRLDTVAEDGVSFADRQINFIELRTDDLSLSADVTNPMEATGFTVDSVSSDGFALDVIFN